MWIVLYIFASLDSSDISSLNAYQTLEAFAFKGYSSQVECQDALANGFLNGQQPDYVLRRNDRGEVWLERKRHMGLDKLKCLEIVIKD